MFKKVFLEKIKESLLLQRKLLHAKVNNKDIEVDREGDEFDEIQANLLIDMQKQLCTRDNQKLVLITQALNKMENNIYGICEDCGEYILEKRLEINPYVSVCVECAEDREITEKQRKRNSY